MVESRNGHEAVRSVRLGHSLGIALCCVLPTLITVAFVAVALSDPHLRAVDFRHEFWPAANRALHGLSPYDLTWQNLPGGIAFPYPALTVVVLEPFGLLPRDVADILFTFVCLGAIPLTLRALDIRDPRIYGVVLMWPPVIQAWQSGNLTMLLTLGIAALWRWRDRPIAAGIITAALISLKPYLWPLAGWLLITRRSRAALSAVVAATLAGAISWAVVGVGQLGAYTHLVHALSTIMSRRGYSVVAAVTHLGLPSETGIAVSALLVLACLAVAVKHRSGDERLGFSLAILATVIASPVVWIHYFAVLLVPVALWTPTISAPWLVPLVLWVGVSTRPSIASIGLAALVCVVCVTPAPAELLRRSLRLLGPRAGILDVRLANR